MDWHEVFLRDDILGDIEFQVGGKQFRGPLKAIVIDSGGIVHIETEWLAVKETADSGWKVARLIQVAFKASDSPPLISARRRIFFKVGDFGTATIFPKGDDKLDPSVVPGLRNIL